MKSPTNGPMFLDARALLALQRTIGNRATRQLVTRHAPNLDDYLPVQRTIIVKSATEDTEYGSNEVEAFKARYAKAEQQRILSAVGGAVDSSPPKTIEAALSDPRRFILTHEEKFGWICEVEEPKEQGPGGGEEAGEKYRLVERPAESPLTVTVKGLIMCIAVIIEARDEKKVIQATTVSHFVPSTRMIKGGELTPEGKQLVGAQVKATKPHGTLSAILIRAEAQNLGIEKTKLTAAEKEASDAIGAVTAFLQSADVSDVKKSVSTSHIQYTLSPDGTSKWS